MRTSLGLYHTGGAAAWTPASLPSLVAWYDASDTATITESGGSVSQWNDKSGNANHLVQGTGSAQPTTGTRTMNSRNVLDFDGTSDFMTVTITPSQPFTCFAVYALDDTSKMRVWDSDSGSGSRALLNPSSGQFGIHAGSTVNVEASDTNSVCHMALYSGSSSKVQIDGTLYTSIDPLTAGVVTGLRVGQDVGGTFGDMRLADLAFCTGDQSASFADYLAYARSYWGTP